VQLKATNQSAPGSENQKIQKKKKKREGGEKEGEIDPVFFRVFGRPGGEINMKREQVQGWGGGSRNAPQDIRHGVCIKVTVNDRAQPRTSWTVGAIAVKKSNLVGGNLGQKR